MTELIPVDHDPFADATQKLDTRYHNIVADEQPHEETSYENLFGATLPVTRTNPGFKHDFENENLNAGREINRGAVLNAHSQMERVRNEPGYIIPETGMRVEPDRNFVPPPRLSAEQENARSRRGQEFVGNMILGASPLGPALAAKSAYEAGSDVPGALRRGDYAAAAGSAGLAALGVAGALPAAAAFRDMASQAHIFAGPLAATADLKALNFAKFSERLGTHPETIWNETGWFRGADGKWRFEIPDNKASLRHALPLGGNTLFSGLEHPELKAAYGEPPHIWGQYGPAHQQTRGSYTPAQPGELPHTTVEAPSAKEAATTALHEYQHHLQHNEGFTPGGNPRMFTPEQIARERARLNERVEPEPHGNDWGSVSGYHSDMTDEDIGNILYHRLAGEVEARNTAHRAMFTPEQRRAAPPWTTEDVPRREQIVFSEFSNKNVPSRSQASETLPLSGSNAPGNFRGTLPEGRELERYSMALTDAEPFLFRGVESSHGLDRAATALEAGNPELARKALGFATQDLAVAAKKLGMSEGKEVARPVEMALQDAMHAEQGLRSAYQAGDPASFREAAQSFKSSLAEAVRARAEIMRGRLEPKAYQYWLDNHVPERTRSILSEKPPFAKGGAVQGGPPRGHPHARLIGGKWLVPDAKRPGELIKAA